ncbi:MAG: polysaccharide deacetylase family protein [Lachnospiraceae bacterium]|jgi:peptidoglycan/xylan/chitin deacetylase (PgdA/CDA1 family)|nr:polysaccharide deacetylase family protein [Lachnospiraceae bacterium]
MDRRTVNSRKLRSQYLKAKKRKKNQRMLLIFLGIIVAIFAIIMYVTHRKINIEIKVKDVSMIQGKAIPKYVVNINSRGSDKIHIGKSGDSGYTTGELVKDLKAGKGVKLSSKVDKNIEGRFTVYAELDKTLAKDIKASKWKRHVKIKITNGFITVKNAVGTWDGTKFKRYNGKYLKNEFVNSKGKLYYLGSDLNKVTGFKQIAGNVYNFGKDGAATTGWVTNGKDKYYIGDNFKGTKGWLTLDDKKYYFAPTNSAMVTGSIQIGLATYTFDTDGVYKSMKKSNIDVNKPMIAITFDDGPGPYTEKLLDAVEKNHAHVTFFMLGQLVNSYPNAVKRMVSLGCETANHSYDHGDLSKMGVSGIQKEVGNTNNNIKKITGRAPTLLRPPYGAVNSTVKSTVGMPMILWDVDTLDWKTLNTAATVKAILDGAKDGNIILLHDIHPTSVEAAIKAMPILNQRGFQLVTVSELAAAKKVNLQAGHEYFNF